MSNEEIHELFPPDDGEKNAPEVALIHVTRHESGGQAWCARSFRPDELTTIAQLFEMFGGGHYELIARDAKRITARRRYKLAGKSRPLNPEPEPEASSFPPPVAAPAAAAPPPGGMSEGFMTIVMNMFSSQLEMMRIQAKQQTDLLVAILGSKKGDDASGLAQVVQAMGANQAALLTALAGMNGGGSTDKVLDAIQTGVELAKGARDAAAEQADSGDDITSIAETINAAAKVIDKVGGGPPPNGAPVPP